MKRSWGLLAIFATVLTLVLAACGQPASTTKTPQQILKLSATAPLATIDLAQATGYGQTGNVYEGLYRLGTNGKATAGLASAGTVSADGLTWTFKIRPTAKWSNGQAITAQDFVYSWRRTITPSTKSPYAYLFASIKNGKAIAAGQAKPETLGVTAKDEKTLVVTLEKPIAYFKVLMAYPLFAPQNQQVVERYGKQYATKSQYMVYSGPFKISNWNGTGNTWQFVKNPYYWDKQAVKLNKITFQVVESPTTGVSLYDTGKLDLTPLAVDQVAKYQKSKDFKSYAYSYVSWLQYNFAAKDATVKKALTNRDIRLAISQSLDRARLTQKALGNGSSVPTGFVPTALASDPQTGTDFAKQQGVAGTVNFDLKSAKKHWATGLQAVGATKLNLELLVSNDDPAQTTTATYLKGQLEKELSGLTITLRSVPSTLVSQLAQAGDFDMMLGGWGADFNDPISFLEIPESGTFYNYGKYNNPAFDALVTRAGDADANDDAARWQDLIEAAKIINTDQAVTPLYQRVTAYLQKPGVTNLVHNTAGTQWGYKYAYMK